MKILGLDTTTLTGSIGLTEDDCPIAEYTLRIDTTHSERVMDSIDRVLKGARVLLKEIDGFAVAHGPGSFTGLRIGLGVVKGLCMATGKPVIPVSSLEVLAYNLPYTSAIISPLLDARKKELYAAFFRWNSEEEACERLSEDGLYTPEQLIEFIRSSGLLNDKIAFLGDGVTFHGKTLHSQLGDRALLLPPWLGSPSGVSVAVIAGRRFMKEGGCSGEELVPVYIQDFPRIAKS